MGEVHMARGGGGGGWPFLELSHDGSKVSPLKGPINFSGLNWAGSYYVVSGGTVSLVCTPGDSFDLSSYSDILLIFRLTFKGIYAILVTPSKHTAYTCVDEAGELLCTIDAYCGSGGKVVAELKNVTSSALDYCGTTMYFVLR